MLRKEELVAQLNDLLGMEHRLSHWQFGQVRRYELKEMVDRVYALSQQMDDYRKQLEKYESTYRPIGGREKESRRKHYLK